MMNPKRLRKLLPILLLSLTAAACGDPDPATERTEKAREAEGDIVVGLAWPLNHAKGTLRDGVELAVEQLNANGGVLGRDVELIYANDKRSVDEGMLIAQRFVENTDMVAAIAHLDSYIAVPTAATYQYGGMVMVTPGAVGMELMEQPRDMVFRSIPNNREGGRQLAAYASEVGYERVLIYYIDNTFGRDLANAFEDRAQRLGVEIADRRSYAKVGTNHRRLMEEWARYYDFDAIFLAGSLPEGADIIREFREVGIYQPIFAGVGLDSRELIELGGEAVEGVVVASVFHPDIYREEVQDFVQTHLERFGMEPDASAAGGYDTMMLLAHAMEQAGTTVPEKVAAALRETRQWQGVTGTHSFDETGEVYDKQMVLNIVSQGEFEFLRYADE